MDRPYVDPDRRCDRLNDSELTNTRRNGRITKNRYAPDAWSDLSEEVKPFPR